LPEISMKLQFLERILQQQLLWFLFRWTEWER
jgi:hypothetical protein